MRGTGVVPAEQFGSPPIEVVPPGRPLRSADFIVGVLGELAKQGEALVGGVVGRRERGLVSRPASPRKLLVLENLADDERGAIRAVATDSGPGLLRDLACAKAITIRGRTRPQWPNGAGSTGRWSQTPLRGVRSPRARNSRTALR